MKAKINISYRVQHAMNFLQRQYDYSILRTILEAIPSCVLKMATKAAYKTTFEPQRVIQPIYTGGAVAIDRSGRILATTLGEDALLTNLHTGEELARIEGDGETISTLTLTPSASHLIICSRSLSMRIYALRQAPSEIQTELVRTLKPHTSPVIILAVDHTSTLLATGCADGTVKVWDIKGGYVTHTFRGPNVLITALHFFELAAGKKEELGISARNRRKEKDEEGADVARGYRLAAGCQDGKVRVWDLFTRKAVATLDSHVADVRGLDFSKDENALLTASRDKTMMWWDAQTWKVKKVVPVLEEIESAGFLQDGLAYTGGLNGVLRIWQQGRELTKPQKSGSETESIIYAAYIEDLNAILAVRMDQVMILSSVEGLEAGVEIDGLRQINRISGTHDEIIDLAYITPKRSLMALATNSEELRIVSVADEVSYFGADVAQLRGHDDIIICIDVDWSGNWVVTGAKDNTARLWRIGETFECVAKLEGHAESIGAISLPKITPSETSAEFKSPLDHPPKYVLTGSQDLTVKKWNVAKSRADYTRKAHDKDINAIDIDHRGVLFASASQDKTVKIWSVEEGETVGILRGHRRGVWSVKFAPKDTSLDGIKGMVVTGSGDKTMKIWNLSDYSCIRTFEGHTNSVLKVAWLKPGEERGRRHIHIVTAGGDGLVTVWDANTGELETTLDNHEDRVWALTVHPQTNMIVSGSGDSTVTFWEDTTTATQQASAAAATQYVEQEQELQNYIHAGSYRDAITLALQLNHPGRLLALFTEVVKGNEGMSGVAGVDEVLGSLTDDQLYTLLLRLRDWNTNARTAHIAQRMLWVVVRSYPAARLSSLKRIKDVVDGLKAYTERHYKRMEELVDESYLVEYTLREMDSLGTDDVMLEIEG